MGKRREPRLTHRLRVTVHGTDYDGNPFTQTAYGVDISRAGARLEGLECLQRPGTNLRLQYRGKQTEFWVAWIGEPGRPYQGQVGVQALHPEQNIWQVALPAPARDTYVSREQVVAKDTWSAPPSSNIRKDQDEEEGWPQRERHRFIRYACQGRAMFRVPGSNANLSGKLTDISYSGCYIEVIMPCPVGTTLELTLESGKTTAIVSAQVRTMHPPLAWDWSSLMPAKRAGSVCKNWCMQPQNTFRRLDRCSADDILKRRGPRW